MADKPVVVGVDGSEESLLAAEWAAREAERRGTPLRIVSAPLPTPRVHAYHASPAAQGAVPLHPQEAGPQQALDAPMHEALDAPGQQATAAPPGMRGRTKVPGRDGQWP
ncbi:MAG: universal stress protein [Streptosporangiaceae bacterium]